MAIRPERIKLKHMVPKICFVVGGDDSSRCGVRDYAVRLADVLSSNETAATVMSAPNWGTKAFLSFCRRLRGEKYDIVHLQYPSIGFKWSLWPHFAGCLTSRSTSVVTLHEHSELPIAQRLSTHLFRWTTARIVFTTEFEAARYKRSVGSWGAAQQIIPIGSNVPTYPTVLARDQNVIYFGQIRPGRGIEEFIELARLSLTLSRPFSFLILGSVPQKHSEYYERIRKHSPPAVEWSMDLSLEDIAKVMAGSFATYLPFPDGASYRRGSMLAAMANGLPVITRAGAATVPELRETVMIADSAREALAHLDGIQGTPEASRVKPWKARTLADQFSWESIALRHVEIYREMLSIGGKL